MTGMKLILFGFLLALIGIGLLFLLSVPNAPFVLTGIFVKDAAVTQVAQGLAQLDPRVVAGIETTVHVLGGIAFFLLAAGLVSAAVGLRREG